MAGVDGAVGGAVVEHVPLATKALYGAVVVPAGGIAPEIVDDDAAVLKALHGVIRYGIAQAGGTALAADGIAVAVGIGKQDIVFPIDLLDRA